MKPFRKLSISMALLAGLFLLPLGGCTLFTPYPRRVEAAQQAFAHGQYLEAAETMSRASPPRRDQALHYMERGAMEHAAGRLEQSNREFLRAVDIFREYDARALISLRDAASFLAASLVSDAARPYRGAPYERVLVHASLATNFLLMGNLESARVEVLQAYERQRELREEHERRIARSRDAASMRAWDSASVRNDVRQAYADQRALLESAGNVYQNAFMYYLSSLVYELGGDLSSAYIDAKTVHELNPAFRPIRSDLLRLSRRLGARGEYDRWRRVFGEGVPDAIPEGHGEIILLHACGLAPVKEEIKLPIPIPVGGRLTIVPIALPKFYARHNPVRAARVVIGDRSLGESQALMSVEATAVRDLWDQAPALAIRQLLRATSRVAMTEFARREGGELAFLLALIFAYQAEQADLRSWISLPRDYQILRAPVPAGTHSLRCDLIGSGGSVLSRVEMGEVEVREGATVVIGLRSTGVHGTARHVVFGP